jgi:hypothetical protein
MKIIRNKASGKRFVYVEDHEDGKALLILPQGETKSLKLDLFEHPEEGEGENFLASGLITSHQIERYRQILDTLELPE